MLRLFAFLLAFAALPAAAEEVVAGLSQNRIAITANFDCSEILIFGAVKRDQAPPPGAGPLNVIITVAGPSQSVIVRRKEHRAGIWVNGPEVTIDSAPAFYAVATSAPWGDVISDTEDLRQRVSIERAIRSVGAPSEIQDAESFTEALIRIRKKSGLYQLLQDKVTLDKETLFDTRIKLPSNLTAGMYHVTIYLTRDRKVISAYTSELDIEKVGLERWIYNLANQQPVIYGLLSLFIAIAAGWSASAVFRYLRS